MQLILVDNTEVWERLKPLTLTRPCAALPLPLGDTIASRWVRLLPEAEVAYETAPYLAAKFPGSDGADAIRIAGHFLPTPGLAADLKALEPGEYLATPEGEVIARRGEARTLKATHSPRAYRRLPDIFQQSRELIAEDFDTYIANRADSQPLPATSTLIGPADRLYIAPGATVEGVIVNTTQGPVYIGADAEIQELTALRGPVSIGRGCRVRAGARLLSGTNLGPVTRVGGEISNAIFLGYANKQHDGFLGDAVIGEWVNIGAGCVASNLKNDYAEIRLWSYPSRRFERIGALFCGPIIGDHTKVAINTCLNTATVLGVGCNIHGSGYPRPFTASFTDGGLQSAGRVVLKKMLSTAKTAMSHRDVELTDADTEILTHIYNDPNA